MREGVMPNTFSMVVEEVPIGIIEREMCMGLSAYPESVCISVFDKSISFVIVSISTAVPSCEFPEVPLHPTSLRQNVRSLFVKVSVDGMSTPNKGTGLELV
jgi:hypothetical protein